MNTQQKQAAQYYVRQSIEDAPEGWELEGEFENYVDTVYEEMEHQDEAGDTTKEEYREVCLKAAREKMEEENMTKALNLLPNE